jgi:hypothetical protein
LSAETIILPRAAINRKLGELITTMAVGMGVFLSGYVISEPAPYELYMAALMAVWAFTALRVPSAAFPLLFLFMLLDIGGMIAMTQMEDLYTTPLYIAVSMFLAFTAVFFASIVSRNPLLFSTIFNSWTIAAVLTAAAGIAGYFDIVPGAQEFTKYGRAAGAFQDPNVFGPFLCLPGVFLVQKMYTGKIASIPLLSIPLIIVIGGIFLSFSRGAWGLFVFAVLFTTLLMLISNRSGRFRLRIIVMGTLAFLIIFAAIAFALQIPEVSQLFANRAHLLQGYDSGRLGRFARYPIALWMAAQHPLGIGALQFGRELGEDTHDIWLKVLLDYSWLGFAAYLTLVVWTIGAGGKILLRGYPWQNYYICVYAIFVGHLLLGTIIDIDHWRHLHILFGLVWAGIVLDRHERQKQLLARPAIPVDPVRHMSIVRAGSERSAAR